VEAILDLYSTTETYTLIWTNDNSFTGTSGREWRPYWIFIQQLKHIHVQVLCNEQHISGNNLHQYSGMLKFKRFESQIFMPLGARKQPKQNSQN
jgi:hypothetical protein